MSLPTYLDESWVYAPAATDMAKNGLGLLPNTISNYLGRGHPLLFHFTGALWLTLFGISVLNLHILSFIIALLLLAITFFNAKRIATNTAAVLCVLFIVLQPIFIAQSGMFLPEMLLALMGLLCIYFYIEEKIVLFNIACTLLLFTKESGLMIPVTLGIYTVITGWKSGFKLIILKEIKYFLFPLLLISLFFITQKVMNGWFFFPEHIGWISFAPDALLAKSVTIFSYSFIYEGRNLLTASFFLFLILKLYRKVKFKEVIISSKYEKLLGISLPFILFYSFFCMLNFFSPRYSLILISIFILLSGIMINDVLKPFWLKAVFIIGFIISQYDTLNYRTNTDHNLGYIDEIKTLQDITRIATENKWQDKIVHADFIPETILVDPASGYVSEKEVFKNENISYCGKQDYNIYICYDRKLEEIDCGKPGNTVLLYSISHGKSRAEIYKVL